ncbi:MAG: PliI family lysozyme inhibitor of I-type lysozyme [Thermodesulfobacteriota bacterium]|nr:PliI family lysozyme inhibitor of I-type lysozyme [Thermodesulfobacteriota bacterium]
MKKIFGAVMALLLCPLTVHAASNFNQLFNMHEISFQVTCPNAGSINQLTITPSGLTIDNSIIEQKIEGTVSGAEIADLNSDGSPEIYVYVTSAGSGSYGDLVAYSSNNNKSISGIYLAPLTDDSINSKGYMGHDAFSIVDNSLRREFPIYKQDDTNTHPSGGMRQLQYKLIAGEAGWQLKLAGSTSP